MPKVIGSHGEVLPSAKGLAHLDHLQRADEQHFGPRLFANPEMRRIGDVLPEGRVELHPFTDECLDPFMPVQRGNIVVVLRVHDPRRCAWPVHPAPAAATR